MRRELSRIILISEVRVRGKTKVKYSNYDDEGGKTVSSV